MDSVPYSCVPASFEPTLRSLNTLLGVPSDEPTGVVIEVGSPVDFTRAIFTAFGRGAVVELNLPADAPSGVLSASAKEKVDAVARTASGRWWIVVRDVERIAFPNSVLSANVFMKLLEARTVLYQRAAVVIVHKGRVSADGTGALAGLRASWAAANAERERATGGDKRRAMNIDALFGRIAGATEGFDASGARVWSAALNSPECKADIQRLNTVHIGSAPAADIYSTIGLGAVGIIIAFFLARFLFRGGDAITGNRAPHAAPAVRNRAISTARSKAGGAPMDPLLVEAVDDLPPAARSLVSILCEAEENAAMSEDDLLQRVGGDLRRKWLRENLTILAARGFIVWADGNIQVIVKLTPRESAPALRE